MRKSIVVLLVAGVMAAALGPAGCTSGLILHIAPMEIKLPTRGVTIPARLIGGIPLVQAKMNSRGPFTFVLDTGAATMVLSPELAQGLGQPAVKFTAYVNDAAGEQTQHHHLRRIHSLELGEAIFYELDAVEVKDLFDNISDRAGVHIDGIIGLQVFYDCLLTLDYANRQIHIQQGRLPTADGEQIIRFDFSGGVANIPLEVGGKTVPATVDSGSVEYMSLSEKTAGIAFASKPVPGPAHFVISGLCREKIARLALDARIGRYVIEKPIVSLGKHADANIGAGILKHFTITFDQHARTVRFVSQKPAHVVIDPLRGIGASFRIRKEAWPVLDVIPGSPAEVSGVLTSDALVSINDRPVSSLGYNALQDLLHTSDKLLLELTRGTKRIKLTVRVCELVH